MANTGFRNSAGTDLDLIFEPIGGGTGPGAAGVGSYKNSAGSELYNLYHRAAEGTPAANVGFKNSFNGDIGPQFAALGSLGGPDVANVPDFTVTAGDTSFPYTARADVVIDSTGYYRKAIASNTISRGSLVNQALYVDTLTGFVASEYEVKCDIVSGTLTGGDSTATWLTCNAEQNWYKYINSSSNPNPQTVVLDITVREVANTANTDTCRVTLTVQGIQ